MKENLTLLAFSALIVLSYLVLARKRLAETKAAEFPDIPWWFVLLTIGMSIMFAVVLSVRLYGWVRPGSPILRALGLY